MSKNGPEESGIASSLLATTAAVALGAAAVWLVQVTASDYVVILAAVLFLNAALAVSLTLSNGLTGLFSLGHPAFMTIGAYVAAILTFPTRRKGMLSDLPEWLGEVELSLLPSVLVAGAVGAFAALLVGFPVLRLRGHYLAVATLGLIVIVQSLATNLDGITRGGAGLNGVPRLTGVWWTFGLLVVVTMAAWRIKFSSLGRAMMATRENELAAECSGIRTVRVRIVAFVIGAFCAALAGALMVHLIGVVTPRSYSVLLAFNLVVMVVIGGQGSIVGAIVAASAITVLSESLRPAEESLGLYGLSQVIVALTLILVLYLRPQGLFGSSEPGFLRRLFEGSRA
jgi:branched-chain amino acid transport system permease protein